MVRKDSTASGQEELHAESITVTVSEEEEEPSRTKPGILWRMLGLDIATNLSTGLISIVHLNC